MTRRFLAVLVGCARARRAPRVAAPPRATPRPAISYGLTDDAWLANGPGTVDDAGGDARRRSASRSCASRVRWDQVAPTEPGGPDRPDRPRLRLGDDRRSVLDALHAHGIDVVLQLDGAPSWANGGKPSNYAPTSARAVRRVRDRGRARIPVGARSWPDLERAEPGALAAADVGAALRHAPAQPRVRRDPRGDPRARRSRAAAPRRAARPAASRRSRGSPAMHARARAARRVRAQPVSARTRSARRRSTRRRARRCTTDHDGDAQPARAARRALLPARAHLADRVRLPEQPARPHPRRLARAAGALRLARARTPRTARRASTC